MYKWFVILATVMLGACASTPKALRGDFANVTPHGVQNSGAPAAHAVRWGGSIVNTIPEKGQTCFIIVSHPLDRIGRPRPGDETMGRFIACAKGFYEPEVYSRHREITVVGRLAGVEAKEVGGYTYRYPKVMADTIHLWDKRSRMPSSAYPAYPGPYSLGYPYALGYPYTLGYPYYYPYGGHYNGLLFEPNLGPFPFYGQPMYFLRHGRRPHGGRQEAPRQRASPRPKK